MEGGWRGGLSLGYGGSGKVSMSERANGYGLVWILHLAVAVVLVFARFDIKSSLSVYRFLMSKLYKVTFFLPSTTDLEDVSGHLA